MRQLSPSDYPWAEPARTGLLTEETLHEGDVSGEVSGRVPVAAVGSNASPTVLQGKLGGLLSTGLPIGEAQVERLAVGHSAHVSARGYVAAAPFAGAASRPVTVCWFDQPQLEAMDLTEPNYQRVPLPGSMPCLLGGEPLTGVEVYDSVHGVLGESGSPLELRDQAGVLGWLGRRLPTHLAEVMDHDRLLDPGLREQVRCALATSDLALPSGLGDG
ncbi:hypothetical protein [Ornithinimicrobium cavernae]|uniref:hypothetical protein n=1 Tax=Ornithinimicrobium cavernae TaxID=2666047 RepID=UPI000D68CD59|nr:hypothetical protein [Ornithinimicrobium cavernae]